MWICFNDGFVSAVADRRRPGRLLVRARKREHLQKLFPWRRIKATPKADYAYRVSVGRRAFARLVAKRIAGIDYSNFKDSVSDDRLHDLYAGFWWSHLNYQNEGEPKMGKYDVRPCICGSGKPSQWLNDAAGIPISRVCETCEAGVRKRYAPSLDSRSLYALTGEEIDIGRYPGGDY